VAIAAWVTTKKRLENFFAANFPLAFRATFIVHTPEVFVTILPFFNEHAPDTDQVFFPVDLLEAIDEVA
jgi:hypothetical protein